MVTASQISEYGILLFWPDDVRAIDELFSNEGNDPYLEALEKGFVQGDGYPYDISVGIGPDGKCVCQLVFFKDQSYYEKYERSGITVFND